MNTYMALHFLNIMKLFYWSSQQMPAQFVVLKLLLYSNLDGIQPVQRLPARAAQPKKCARHKFLKTRIAMSGVTL